MVGGRGRPQRIFTQELTLGAAILACLAWTERAPGEESVPVRAPMQCSRGPDTQFYEARVTVPASVQAGAAYTVRIAAATSPVVSGIGLSYLHDFLTEYYLPEGGSYVAGSARLVDGTGSENVRAGARAWFEDGYVRLYLPGHVDSGSTFTPPVVEFQVKAPASPGASLPVRWVRHRVTAKVFLIGNLDILCSPKVGPLVLGTTAVKPPP